MEKTIGIEQVEMPMMGGMNPYVYELKFYNDRGDPEMEYGIIYATSYVHAARQVEEWAFDIMIDVKLKLVADTAILTVTKEVYDSILKEYDHDVDIIQTQETVSKSD